MVEKTFTINTKFLKELHKRLVKFSKKPYGVELSSTLVNSKEIPSLNHLEEIISAMFWASTQFEEGRLLRFRVAYTVPSGIEHLAMGFKFSSLKKWNAEEIRKLASAIVPPDGVLCVYPLMNSLVIYGLQSTTFTNITFEMIDPGRMIIRLWFHDVIAEINGQKSGFIGKDWSHKANDLLSTYESDENNKVLKNFFYMLYQDMTKEILNRIRLLRHGGTLIFVQDNDNWKKSVEKPISYESEMRFNGLRHIEENLDSKIKSIAKIGINKEFFEIISRKLESYEYKTFIGDAARTYAYLTSIDGALVLNKKFDVLAFGVKIKEIQKGRSQMVTKISPYENAEKTFESTLTHEFRGKRHLSAARFALSNPDSVVFTVSQDGGITGFKMEEGKLLAYKGLELLL